MNLNKGPGRFAATVGISAVVTAGFGWPEVLLGWCIAAMLRLLIPRRAEGQYNIICMWMVFGLSVLITAGIVLAAEKAFPEDGTFPFVSVGLLLLLYRSLIGEKETGAMVSNVLGLILLGLLGVILLFGFADVQWGEIMPTGFQWQQVWSTVAVASPWWSKNGEKDSWEWFCAGVLITTGLSVMCRGVLGAALTEYSDLPLYQAVQTIHILGTLQRFEALLAASVLLGTFAMLTQVGDIMRNTAEILMPNTANRKWAAAALVISYFVEHLYMLLNKMWRLRLSMCFWVLIPIFAMGSVFVKKDKKSLDKTHGLE